MLISSCRSRKPGRRSASQIGWFSQAWTYPNGIPSASVGGPIGRDRALFAAAAAAAAADRYVTAVASHHVVVIAHSMGSARPHVSVGQWRRTLERVR